MRRIPLPEPLAAIVELHCLDWGASEERRPVWQCLEADDFFRLASEKERVDRMRLIATRAAARSLLARRLGRDPQSIDIRLESDRPAEVSAIAGKALQHSPLLAVAHAGCLSLIAIGDSMHVGSLGVALEWCDMSSDPLALAELCCSRHEQEMLRRAVDPLAAFHSLWVAKEAALRAVGAEVPDQFQSLSIDIVSDGRPATGGAHPGAQPALKGYVAALCWSEGKRVSVAHRPTASALARVGRTG